MALYALYLKEKAVNESVNTRNTKMLDFYTNTIKTISNEPMEFLLNSQPKHTYFLHSTNTFTEAQTHLKVSIGFWSSLTGWPSCQCVVEKCSSTMVWRSHRLCASTFWSATATGQPMLLVCHRHWSANATGQPPPLVRQ